MYCFKCKKEIEDGSNFCIYCGSKIIPSFSMDSNNPKMNDSYEEDSNINKDRLCDFSEDTEEKKETLVKSTNEQIDESEKITSEEIDNFSSVDEHNDFSNIISGDNKEEIELINNPEGEKSILTAEEKEADNVENSNDLSADEEIVDDKSSNEEIKNNKTIYEKNNNKYESSYVKSSLNNIESKNNEASKNKKIRLAVLSAALLIAVIIAASIWFNMMNIKKKCDSINDYVSKYNEDQIDYDTAKSAINEIDTKNKEEIISCQKSALSQLDRIKKNKDNYKKAKKDLNNGSYEKAIDTLEEIPKDDHNYQDAQELLTNAQQNYIDEVNESIKAYLEKNDFESANNVVDKAITVVPSQKENLERKKAEIEEAKNAFVKKQINDLEKSAKANKEKGDYLSAIKDYKKLYEITKDDAYEGSINNAEIEWVNSSIKAAETKLAEGHVEEALNCLKDAQENVQDRTVINEEIQRIMDYKPVNLVDKTVMAYEISSYSCDVEDWDETICDNTGKYYDGKGIIFRVPLYGSIASQSTSKYWIKYSIEGKYDYLSSKLAIPGNNKNYLNPSMNMRLKIYCDDKLIYTSEALTGGSLPIEINDINITGAKTLTMELEVKNDNSERIFSSHAAIGWHDAFLTKKYEPLE